MIEKINLIDSGSRHIIEATCLNWGTNQEVCDLKVQPGWQLMELMTWWQHWGPMFKNSHFSVQDALNNAQIMHTLTKDQPTNNVR